MTGTAHNSCSPSLRYVQQEESLVGVLTARETLIFAARLAGMPLSHVDVVLSEMGLESTADTPVGTIFSKGMSGGQKRRLSIAIELISTPTLLYLDEPTSGLDSASAWHVLQHMRSLARVRKCAIVASLHSPSHDIWKLVDVASFLSEGRLIYFGSPGQRLLNFFADTGYTIPPHTNIPVGATSFL